MHENSILIPKPDLESLTSELLQREYGVSDWDNDLGGPTSHGITEQVAKEYGYYDVKEVTTTIAEKIFEDKYYYKPRLNLLPDVRLQWRLLVDGLHSGPRRIIPRLQKLLNFHNRLEKDYPDIKTDGYLGPVTIATIYRYMNIFVHEYNYKSIKKDQLQELFWMHLCEELRALQFAWYFDIVDRKPEQEQFFNGWKNRIAFPPRFYTFNT